MTFITSIQPGELVLAAIIDCALLPYCTTRIQKLDRTVQERLVRCAASSQRRPYECTRKNYLGLHCKSKNIYTVRFYGS